MKITFPYLRKAFLWSLSILVAIGGLIFLGFGVTSLLVRVFGTGVLFFIAAGVYLFLFLMAVYIGIDFAVEILTKRRMK